MSEARVTEQESLHNNLHELEVSELLVKINEEDAKVTSCVAKVIPQIESLASAVVDKLLAGGRLFYLGAGTSGRLGIVDASECPPTYGVPDDWVIGLIAGGDGALRKAVENAEDDFEQAWLDLKAYNINSKDVLVGIAASGRTPYVIGGLRDANKHQILTACITCNKGSAVVKEAQYPVEVVVGPEFVTGSTRMKSGTAQKLALNMISTSVMVKLGRVKGNKMVDMQLSNEKLVERGTNMVASELQIDKELAEGLLLEHKSVRAAVDHYRKTNK